MTKKTRNHSNEVETWINEATKNLSSEQLALLSEQVFGRLYKCSRVTLSGVMLEAIMERVVFNSSENYSILRSLSVNETGIRFEELHKVSSTLSEELLKEALQTMLTEFIAIIDRITNAVFTPSLYSELSKVRFEPKLKVVMRTNGEKS